MNAIAENERYPDITFNKSGLITISSHIAKRLNLSDGDTINIIVDGHEYMLVANHVQRCDDGTPVAHYKSAVKRIKKSGSSMRCHFQKLCTAINFITGAEEESALFCGTPRDNWKGYPIAIPIITSNCQSK